MISKNINNLRNKYQYSEQDLLGKGATGHVYKGINIQQNKNVAIKVIPTSQMNNVQKNLLQNEKKALTLIKNNNIMKVYDIFQDNGITFIISELYQGGTLKEYLQKNGQFRQFQAMQFFRKIVSGYLAVVEANVIHRDLKSSNIMLTKNNQPTIIDFGYSQIIVANKNLTVFNVGSPSYMSPQAYTKTIYSQKSDIWSLGAIFYELLTNSTLDKGVPVKQYFQKLQTVEYPSTILFQNFGEVAQQILRGCLATKPQKRITAHKIKYILDKQIISKQLNKKTTIISNQNKGPKFGSFSQQYNFKKLKLGQESASSDNSIKQHLQPSKSTKNILQNHIPHHQQNKPLPKTIQNITSIKSIDRQINKWNVLSNSNNANIAIAGPSNKSITAQLVHSANINQLRKTCTNMKDIQEKINMNLNNSVQVGNKLTNNQIINNIQNNIIHHNINKNQQSHSFKQINVSNKINSHKIIMENIISEKVIRYNNNPTNIMNNQQRIVQNNNNNNQYSTISLHPQRQHKITSQNNKMSSYQINYPTNEQKHNQQQESYSSAWILQRQQQKAINNQKLKYQSTLSYQPQSQTVIQTNQYSSNQHSQQNQHNRNNQHSQQILSVQNSYPMQQRPQNNQNMNSQNISYKQTYYN